MASDELLGVPEQTPGATATTRHAASIAGPVSLPALVATEDRPARVYLARLALSGRRVQATALTQIAGLLSGGSADADTLPWGELRYHHTQAIRGYLAETFAPATANRMLAALRGVLTEAWRLGHMSAEDLHRATDLAAVRGNRPPAGRHLSQAEITAVLVSCDRTPGGLRGAARWWPCCTAPACAAARPWR